MKYRKFDFDAARAGAPVQTKRGEDVRIVRFDLKSTSHSIVAIVSCGNIEKAFVYTKDGICRGTESDLVMAPDKFEGWVNVYYDEQKMEFVTGVKIYATEGQAEDASTIGEWSRNLVKVSIAKIEFTK